MTFPVENFRITMGIPEDSNLAKFLCEHNPGADFVFDPVNYGAVGINHSGKGDDLMGCGKPKPRPRPKPR